MTLLHEEQTPYAHFRIVQRGRRVDMDVKGAVFATYHPDRLLTGYSWDALTAAACLTPYRKVRRLLMLGVTGGTALRQMRHLWPQTEMVGLEIDGQLVDAAVRHMGLADCDVDVRLGDADRLLEDLDAPFDVIVDDLYKCGPDDVERGGNPFSERLPKLQSLLAPKGIVVANFINDRGFEASLETGRRALTERFRKVARIRSLYGFNEVLVGGKELKSAEEVRSLAARWEHSGDRQYWREFQVEGLKG